MSAPELSGWDRLRHGGLLLDPPRLRRLAEHVPPPLPSFYERELRRQASAVLDGGADVPEFLSFVLQKVCGFSGDSGTWQRGSQIGAEWSRTSITGEAIKPRQLWRAHRGGTLPVFYDDEPRIGIGRGRKAASQVVQWLRAGPPSEHGRLALLSNGRQRRLIFAGLDFDAHAEWDVDLWFAEGELSPQVTALRTLLSPALWTKADKDAPAPLLQAIQDSRKGQAELSAVLGERVREAVELLVQSHDEALNEGCADVDPADIYRAACRVVMRMVVVLFAESRELLPRDNAIYHGSYGLGGLLEELERIAARGGNRLARSWNAWPRVLALFRLVASGSHHPNLSVPAYGGELFARAAPDAIDGLTRALHVFENACFDRELLSDQEVRALLERITRTRVKIRQGRTNTWVPAPVDFSDLSSEYIGILYEGLLDFELKTAPSGDPIIFLAVGNQPALPLSRLEAMDDHALANLLEKMKDTSKEEDDEAATDDEVEVESDAPESELSDGDADDATDEPDEPESTEPIEAPHDPRHRTRTRAEVWARRAVLMGKLVRKPKGKPSPEKQLSHEHAIGRKARQIVTKVILPGERYLVRWGGTRKGSGTFYTRPGLAIPTVQRTLRPLAYEAPVGQGGEPDAMAPPAAWKPKRPEEILALKVCDPACGSGTFPVAALRFLTDALYSALHHHGRITSDGERGLVRLLEGPPAVDVVPGERLADELAPCRPEDAHFEPRLKAILRRHVVERCIYGVDLDPLAVELCRLALWIETMDRTLPFSFLDHKIKCGNGLVGAWFDQFQHYPVMAWKNREGGDKNHGSGVHFAKEARTKAIKAFVKELGPDLGDLLRGQMRLFTPPGGSPAEALAKARATLSKMHALAVQDSEERARIYREEFQGGEGYRAIRSAMDLWCACWFWPADEIENAPLPSTFAAPPPATLDVAAEVAASKRFFHWELEFPDVFREPDAGFDAILGNPPWDIAKPSSKEFFSNIDPLYRSYGKQEALAKQREYFGNTALVAADLATVGEQTESMWLDYSADFRAQSNFVSYAANAYGDPTVNADSADRFVISRKRDDNLQWHHQWRALRATTAGFSDAAHTFRHQGSADLNLYKLFLEQAHALLRIGGRLGFIVPSGLYSDHGTGSLRALFLDRCRWEWLFGFENRDRVFAIHRSFKFNPIVIEKGGATEAIQTAFMRRKLEDWERAEEFTFDMSRSDVEEFSPRSRVVLEFESREALLLARRVVSAGVRLAEHASGPGRDVRYIHHEFFATADSKHFPPRDAWTGRGYSPTVYGHWQNEKGQRALPIIEGRMIDFYDFSAKGWVSGRGRAAKWEAIDWNRKVVRPQFLVDESVYRRKPEVFAGWKVTMMDVTSATNARTVIATAGRELATVDSCRNLVVREGDLCATLGLVQVLNCIVFDWLARYRVGGLHVTWFQLEEMAVPDFAYPSPHAASFAFRLCAAHERYAPDWLLIDSLLGSLCMRSAPWKACWATCRAERSRIRAMLDARVMALYGMDFPDARFLLRDCDYPRDQVKSSAFTRTLDPKGFWRIDKDKDPELRHTVLTLVAFHDLQQKIAACGGDRGIEAFLTQNDGEGWLLPETLRLADYGLGHDDRAKEPQPVAGRLGPRFYDWQLAQSPEESWRECHLHARNLLGKPGYLNLLADTLLDKPVSAWADALRHASDLTATEDLIHIFARPLARLAADAWRPTLDAIARLVTTRGLPFEHAHRVNLLERALSSTLGEQRHPALRATLDLLAPPDIDAILSHLLSIEEADTDTAWRNLIRASIDPPRFARLTSATSGPSTGTQPTASAPPAAPPPPAGPKQSSLFPEDRG